MPALSLVHWYTQHPSRPPPPPLEKLTHVSLIGNGNVALDVARLLLTSVSVLEKYDVPRSVLDVLSRSQVKHVSIFGRRGPLDAAFTMKELREMINLPEASMVPVRPSLLEPPPGTALTRQQSRVLRLLQEGSKNPPGSTSKTWSLDFFRSPVGLVQPTGGSSLTKLTLAHTMPDPTDAREISSISTSMVITSLGFHADPSSPFYDPALRHLRTAYGRLVTSAGKALKNVYVSGWAATGAKGVLAATMINAYAIADTILSDWMPNDQRFGTSSVSPPNSEVTEDVLTPDPHPERPPQEIVDSLRYGLVTEYHDWKTIDAEEVRRGEVLGKERERMGWEEARTFLAGAREP
jgi:adrenodoxin-NADP+ reductase